MKVAMPTENGYINQHFGQSKEFTIIELADGKIASTEVVSAENLQHNHDGLAGLMTSNGVKVVILGGIGAGALTALEQSGLKVIYGAKGKVEDVVEVFSRGELVSQGSSCCHHRGQGHGHGHGGGCRH